ncbi:esterase C25G4.2 isoform X2 [Manihot esculenta]|uniref:esterase C25G4.2 isoform X2 n=1 Tax=Manihot esculenta TaxID=3983 RepID=UPI000B5D242C|nr:esterase C25G4.2 isoform X2 [Manihot esculenta]
MDLEPVEVFSRSNLANGILLFSINFTCEYVWEKHLQEFPDGIFPAKGKSDIEGIFPPPYFEWFQYNEEFTEYTNLEECISYLCEYITSNGPFDGLLGFSQGATLSALLIGYQIQKKVLKEHPPMKLLVSISGTKFRDPTICEVAYKDIIKVKSVHFIGAKDWLRLPSEELATAFDNPLIIRHPQGHTVPRLDEEATEKLRAWATEIIECNSKVLEKEEAKVNEEKKPEMPDKIDKQEQTAASSFNQRATEIIKEAKVDEEKKQEMAEKTI